MSLKISTAKLGRAVKDLHGAWQEARSDWRDARATGFEQEYVMPVASCLKTALTGLDHMDGILAQARRDCG